MTSASENPGDAPGPAVAPRAEAADVVVVGAGPGGAATAAYLAGHGLDVVLLEKATFPRDKICGDGLTPRAVKELTRLGIDTDGGWARNARPADPRRRPHPDPRLARQTAPSPATACVRTRAQLDETLARHAQAQRRQASHERTSVTAPIHDDRTGRVVGVTAKLLDERGRATGETVAYRAPVVVAADGVSSRLATAVGRRQARQTGSWASPSGPTTAPRARGRLPRIPP
ncbi:MAG: FAD-dependent oxidoreductase [Dermatophilaceae bacterium]